MADCHQIAILETVDYNRSYTKKCDLQKWSEGGKDLLVLFKKIGRFISKLNKKPSLGSKYVDLAPTDNADEKGVYRDALLYATQNPNISNIALTGPYGSGKSSIIKTFLKSYDGRALKISLAAFLPEMDNKKADIDTERYGAAEKHTGKQEIERSILQQMLYGADANKLPLSRFKRIQYPGKLSLLLPAYAILGVFVCWRLIDQHAEIISGKYFLPISLLNWYNWSAFVIGIIFIWTVAYHIYVRSFAISLKSISLKDIEIVPDSVRDESILNRHMDEIIYFFQSTNYDLVVIEDLDRFDNSEIFVTLREINSLINANAGVKRSVRFLYALRDNMFVNTDRTKFFEFIIPVIPIINTSNSIDKVLLQGERLALLKYLDRQFLREVSRYLNDLRLIQNIFNEYAVYVSNLDSEGDKLDANRLLAILIYKNVLPSDFEALHRGKGHLADILSRKDNLIAKAEALHKGQISDLEGQIAASDRQLASNMDELRKIYAMALIGKSPAHCSGIQFNGQNIPFNAITGHSQFDQIVEAEVIGFLSPHYGTQNVNTASLQNEVDAAHSYKVRKKDIERKSREFRETTSQAIRDLRLRITELRVTPFNKIVRAHPKETEEFFAKFEENRALVTYLIFEGYLDDSYYQYISLFHSGRLSPNDNKYLIQVRSFNNPEPDFQIDNPKEVIVLMRDDDFRQNFALNKTLVDCLFESPIEHSVKVSMVLEFISLNFAECDRFFATYYDSGKYVDRLLTGLVQTWPGFLPAAMDGQDRIVHVTNVIARLPEASLKKLSQDDDALSKFVASNLPEILAQKVDIDPARFGIVRPLVEDLSTLEAHPAVTRLLADEGLYTLTSQNITFIIRSVIGSPFVGDLETRNYTTILKLGDDRLSKKIQENFSSYVKEVLIPLQNNSEEDLSAILAIIHHDDVDIEYLQQFLKTQSAKLPLLSDAPDRLHATVFDLQKIEPSWDNCNAFLSSSSFDSETLTAYLERADTLAALTKSVSIENTDSVSIRAFLVENDDMSDDIYRTYVRTLSGQFDVFPSNLSSVKLRILIEEEKIVFSQDNFAFLKGNGDLQALFTSKNIDRFLDLAGEIADDNLREALLNTHIGDDSKLKIIAGMDLSLLIGLPNRAGVVGRILERTKVDVVTGNPTAVQAIIMNSKPVTIQISLLNKLHQTLSDSQVAEVIQAMPRAFRDIKPGWKQPTIENTSTNREFVEWLETRHLISSSKVTMFDEIRIFNRRP